MKWHKDSKKVLLIALTVYAILSVFIVFMFVILVHGKNVRKEESVNKGKIMISQTVPDPEMVEINPTNDGYYYVVYKPEGSVFICHRWGRPERIMVPALHADGSPVTAWDLGIAEELGLEAR